MVRLSEERSFRFLRTIQRGKCRWIVSIELIVQLNYVKYLLKNYYYYIYIFDRESRRPFEIFHACSFAKERKKKLRVSRQK